MLFIVLWEENMAFSHYAGGCRHLELASVDGVTVLNRQKASEPSDRNYAALLVCLIFIVVGILALGSLGYWLISFLIGS
ncbi:MAG: hypothetical protein DI585_01365 [Pseudomonas fluorescens]|nr:MAG: hypothetical protein DI585_01365 [Pseudomonas fluorescens]